MEPTRNYENCSKLDSLQSTVSVERLENGWEGNTHDKIFDVPHGPWQDPIQPGEQEIQVSMDGINNGAELPVTNGPVPCYKNGSSGDDVKWDRRVSFDPKVSIKVEMVKKVTAPRATSGDSTSPESLSTTTIEEVVN